MDTRPMTLGDYENLTSHQTVKINNLEAENEDLRAEVERLIKLQNPMMVMKDKAQVDAERLERIATAAMQALIPICVHDTNDDASPAIGSYPRYISKMACAHARALIAELDGKAS